MTHVASISEARNHLPALVHRAESGESITLTRRGKTVAVLLSITEYERMQRGGVDDFWLSVQAFRADEDVSTLQLADALSGIRDATAGRDVSW